MDITNHKILIAFDMDNTIISKTVDYEIMKLLPKNALAGLPEPEGPNADWAEYMQKVFNRMKLENINIEDIKRAVEDISLNEGFDELFEFIRSKRSHFDSIIISGANDLFVKWVVDKNKINDIFSNYFSNFACPHDKCLINIKQHHMHNCTICDRSICKKIVLENQIHKNLSKNNPHNFSIYIGDGDNDYCPSTILGEKDILFPRQDYILYNMLYHKDLKKNLKCKILPWKNGGHILMVLKNLI